MTDITSTKKLLRKSAAARASIDTRYAEPPRALVTMFAVQTSGMHCACVHTKCRHALRMRSHELESDARFCCKSPPPPPPHMGDHGGFASLCPGVGHLDHRQSRLWSACVPLADSMNPVVQTYRTFPAVSGAVWPFPLSLVWGFRMDLTPPYSNPHNLPAGGGRRLGHAFVRCITFLVGGLHSLRTIHCILVWLTWAECKPETSLMRLD